MNNKNIYLTLWSLPVECADVLIGKMRNLASSYILNGEDEKAEDLMRCIRDAENQLSEFKKGVESDESIEI